MPITPQSLDAIACASAVGVAMLSASFWMLAEHMSHRARRRPVRVPVRRNTSNKGR